MRAMILCAGLGKRMQPLTRCWAKPALPILDEPLVLRLVRALADQGVDTIIVNSHARTDSLLAALAEAPIPVEVSHESELLGSGGGIRRARRFLEGSEPFVVLNGDMRLDLDLGDLLAEHSRGGGLATLALRDDPRKHRLGSIGYDEAGAVRRITRLLDLGGKAGDGLFLGVQVMDPRIFQRMPDRDVFEILPDVHLPALRDGEQIHAWCQPLRCEWSPVGDPGELLAANLTALRAVAEHPEGVIVGQGAKADGHLQGPAWIGAGAEIASGAHVGPWAVISAGARVAHGTRVEHALLFPGARPPAGAHLYRAIGFAEGIWTNA